MKVLREYEKNILSENIFGQLKGNKKWPWCMNIRCWFNDTVVKKFTSCCPDEEDATKKIDPM